MDKTTAFKALMFEAFTMARFAHTYCFNDSEKNIVEDKETALSYAAACTAKYSAAEAMYWCSPEMEDEDIPALFAKFNSFTDEIRSDYRDNHSRQWVDIEFNQLEALYQNFECKMKQN